MTNQNQNQPPAGQTILFNATLFFAVIVFLGAFGYGIASNMSDYAKLVIGIVAVTLIIVLPFCALVIAIMRRVPQTQIRVVDGQADYDTPKQPRQIAQQPRYELPAPAYEEAPQWANYRPPPAREVFIPRYAENGTPKPYGFDSAATSTLATNDATGQRITVDARLLSRFLACATPSRKEWTGGTEGYTAASAFCCEQGMTIKLANGGQRWRPEYQDGDTRLEWAQSLTV